MNDLGKYVDSIIPLTDSKNNLVMAFENESKTVSYTHPHFKKIRQLVIKGKIDEALELADITTMIKKHSCGLFNVLDGIVYVEDNGKQEALPESLSKRLLEFAERKLPVKPLLSFWYNVKKNPSVDAVEDLYDFLQHNNIPLTDDGCFLAYKRVSNNFESITSGVWEQDENGDWNFDRTKHYNHSVGSVVEMPREKVEHDRNVACASGLHAAAFNYANNFYFNGTLVLVKINPEDVVSVPLDYNQEKMRVCKYTVLEEVDKPREEKLYGYDDDFWDDDDYDFWEDDDDFWDDDYDDFDDDFDDEPVHVNEEFKLNMPDVNGRLTLKNNVIKQLGLRPGDKLYAVPNIHNNIVKFKMQKPLYDVKSYIVDMYYNIKFTKNLLPNWDYNNLSVYVDENEGTIVVQG